MFSGPGLDNPENPRNPPPWGGAKLPGPPPFRRFLRSPRGRWAPKISDFGFKCSLTKMFFNHAVRVMTTKSHIASMCRPVSHVSRLWVRQSLGTFCSINVVRIAAPSKHEHCSEANWLQEMQPYLEALLSDLTSRLPDILGLCIGITIPFMTTGTLNF